MELDVLNALLGEHLSRQGADVLYYYLSTIQNFEAEVKKLRASTHKDRCTRHMDENMHRGELQTSQAGEVPCRYLDLVPCSSLITQAHRSQVLGTRWPLPAFLYSTRRRVATESGPGSPPQMAVKTPCPIAPVVAAAPPHQVHLAGAC